MPVEARNFHQAKHPAYTEDGTERNETSSTHQFQRNSVNHILSLRFPFLFSTHTDTHTQEKKKKNVKNNIKKRMKWERRQRRD